jgi:hypothetical protein
LPPLSSRSRFFRCRLPGIASSIRGTTSELFIQTRGCALDRNTGRDLGDVQIQGIRTGLARDGIPPEEDGIKRLEQALADVVYSLYLYEFGVEAPHWGAIALVEDGSARFVRAGRFERFAHPRQLVRDPVALRQFFDYLNAIESARLGRPDLLSLAELQESLIASMAPQLARVDWARVALGNVSYDNVGFFAWFDLERASVVDLTHPGYSSTGEPPGYGNQAGFVLGRMGVGELGELMRAAEMTEEETRALQAVASEEIAHRTYYQAMAALLMRHLGCDDDLARAVLRQRPGEVMELLAVVIELWSRRSVGETRRMGTRGEEVVHEPARYDVFGALAELAAVYSSRAKPQEQLDLVLRALRPSLLRMLLKRSDCSRRQARC